MTRQIKFRAYNKDWKMMVPPEDIEKIMFDGVTACAVDVQFNITTTDGQRNSNVWEDSGDIVLMQFTGLLDKNGKEIYEGDVVKGRDTFGSPHPDEFHSKRFTGKVIWDLSGFRIEYPAGKYGHNYGDFTDIDDLEILGNIYEHPHLLTSEVN